MMRSTSVDNPSRCRRRRSRGCRGPSGCPCGRSGARRGRGCATSAHARRATMLSVSEFAPDCGGTSVVERGVERRERRALVAVVRVDVHPGPDAGGGADARSCSASSRAPCCRRRRAACGCGRRRSGGSPARGAGACSRTRSRAAGSARSDSSLPRPPRTCASSSAGRKSANGGPSRGRPGARSPAPSRSDCRRRRRRSGRRARDRRRSCPPRNRKLPGEKFRSVMLNVTLAGNLSVASKRRCR